MKTPIVAAALLCVSMQAQTRNRHHHNPPPPPPPSTASIWSADMETGNLSQWNNGGGEFDSGNAYSQAVMDFAHTGKWSARLNAATPPESATRLFRWAEPQTYPNLYYNVWYYFPRSYKAPDFWNVLQWKSKTSSKNDPFFILNVGNRSDGTMYFYFYNWQTRQSYTQTLKNLPVGQWFKVTAFYSCAGNGTGHVTVWQDGTQLFDLANVQTRYSDGDCQWSVNNYSDSLSPSPSSIYIDDVTIGTTQ